MEKGEIIQNSLKFSERIKRWVIC